MKNKIIVNGRVFENKSVFDSWVFKFYYIIKGVIINKCIVLIIWIDIDCGIKNWE